MTTIKVDFTTIHGYTVSGTFTESNAQNIVEKVKSAIYNKQVMYIGNGVYLNAEHVYTYRLIQQ